jgi:hypothetical protein
MPSGSMLVDLVLLGTEIDIARSGRRWKRIIGQDSQVNLRARSHDWRKGRVMSSEVELVSSIAIEPVPLKSTETVSYLTHATCSKRPSSHYYQSDLPTLLRSLATYVKPPSNYIPVSKSWYVHSPLRINTFAPRLWEVKGQAEMNVPDAGISDQVRQFVKWSQEQESHNLRARQRIVRVINPEEWSLEDFNELDERLSEKRPPCLGKQCGFLGWSCWA